MSSTEQEMTDALRQAGDDEAFGNELSLNLVLQILIPQEVTTLIFDRLKLVDKLSSRCVCSLWTSFVDQTLDISPLLCDESALEVMNFGSTGVELGRLIVSRLHTFQYPNEGLGFSRIRELQVVSNSVFMAGVGISEVNLALLLEDYSDIEELCLSSSVFRNINCPSILQTVELNFLKKLKISAYNGDGQGFPATVDILHNSFPSLESAEIFIANREENMIQIPLNYTESYRFLANHASTLTEIILGHRNSYHERLQQWAEPLDHSIPLTEFSSLLEKIDMIKVSDLTLEITHYEGRSQFQFGIQLLKAQTNLTSLKLVNICHSNIAVWNVVPQVLRKCSETLRKISTQGCFCLMEAGMMEQFSCSCVNSSKLTVIRIDICGLQIMDIEDLPKQTRILSLGEMLTDDQITFVANNMTNLEEWKLLQGMTQFDVTVPKVTIEIFKDVVKLPVLTKLVLRKRNSALKRIRRIISYTPGIEEVAAEDETHIKLLLDRNRFDPNRL